jgi:hypothetical protein
LESAVNQKRCYSKARNYPQRFDTALRARASQAGKKEAKAQSASAFSTIHFFCTLRCAFVFRCMIFDLVFGMVFGLLTLPGPATTMNVER